MRLARLRHLAWVAVLAFLAGLATPALASMLGGDDQAAPATFAHVHADGSAHGHDKVSAPTVVKAAASGGVRMSKAPQHCPGCLTAAQCAVACLGVGLLPTSVPVPAAIPAVTRWDASAMPAPAGAIPAGDLDPPRPVLVS